MEEIVITQEMLNAVNVRINRFKFNDDIGLSRFGSEKDRTFFGYLGEMMVMSYLDLSHDYDDYEFDLIYKGKKLEVKSISCKFKPPLHFLCTVNSFDLSGVHKQSADFYVFTRILNDKTKGWILGYMGCEEYFQKGKFVPKGTEVVKGVVNFVKANATVLEISKLYPVSKLKSL